MYRSPVFALQTATITSANAYLPLGVDNAWNFKQFKKDFRIKVNRLCTQPHTQAHLAPAVN